MLRKLEQDLKERIQQGRRFIPVSRVGMRCGEGPFASIRIKRLKVSKGISKYIKVIKGGRAK